jgi:hypothetical protein
MKLGSIIVHADEYFSTDGDIMDQLAMKSLLEDSEVQTWLEQMDKKSLLPKKRK